MIREHVKGPNWGWWLGSASRRSRDLCNSSQTRLHASAVLSLLIFPFLPSTLPKTSPAPHKPPHKPLHSFPILHSLFTQWGSLFASTESSFWEVCPIPHLGSYITSISLFSSSWRGGQVGPDRSFCPRSVRVRLQSYY